MGYHYDIVQGAKQIKTKIAVAASILVLGLSGMGVAVAVAGTAQAHNKPPKPRPFTLKPFEFVGTDADCGPGTAGDPDKVTAEWVKTTGNEKPSIKLQKLGPTTGCLAAGVDIISPLEGGPVSELTELNFDVKDGWHCGAGAPRFNVQTDAGTSISMGCGTTLAGTQTSLGNGWTHVEYSAADITSQLPVGSTTIVDIYMIFDEGSDTGPDFTGTAFVDNISVNDDVVGSPSVPRDKNDCKNDGWQNLTDRKGNPFDSQQDCKDFLDRGDKDGHHHGDGMSNHLQHCLDQWAHKHKHHGH